MSQIYTDEANRAILQQLLPEAIISGYMGYDEEELKTLLGWADVICIGCGLGKKSFGGKTRNENVRACGSSLRDRCGWNQFTGMS